MTSKIQDVRGFRLSFILPCHIHNAPSCILNSQGCWAVLCISYLVISSMLRTETGVLGCSIFYLVISSMLRAETGVLGCYISYLVISSKLRAETDQPGVLGCPISYFVISKMLKVQG